MQIRDVSSCRSITPGSFISYSNHTFLVNGVLPFSESMLDEASMLQSPPCGCFFLGRWIKRQILGVLSSERKCIVGDLNVDINNLKQRGIVDLSENVCVWGGGVFDS